MSVGKLDALVGRGLDQCHGHGADDRRRRCHRAPIRSRRPRADASTATAAASTLGPMTNIRTHSDHPRPAVRRARNDPVDLGPPRRRDLPRGRDHGHRGRQRRSGRLRLGHRRRARHRRPDRLATGPARPGAPLGGERGDGRARRHRASLPRLRGRHARRRRSRRHRPHRGPDRRDPSRHHPHLRRRRHDVPPRSHRDPPLGHRRVAPTRLSRPAALRDDHRRVPRTASAICSRSGTCT